MYIGENDKTYFVNVFYPNIDSMVVIFKDLSRISQQEENIKQSELNPRLAYKYSKIINIIIKLVHGLGWFLCDFYVP